MCGCALHFRWTCDCRLRSFRLWLTQSNVPRMVEPSCQGPRRLVGIHIQSLSLAEFACAPQLSPTSMYLTVPKGKNVSIVCRVASDPVSTITWYFNGQKIHSSDNENSNMVSKMSLFQLQNSATRCSDKFSKSSKIANVQSVLRFTNYHGYVLCCYFINFIGLNYRDIMN